MSEIQKVTTHRLVVGATPDVMEAARSAAAEVARDFYADAIRKGRCDSDEIVLVAARAILTERERCAKVADGRDCTNPFAPLNAAEGWLRQQIAAAIRRGDAP